MDNYLYGLSLNTKSYPSILLKEKLLEVLETKEIALDSLLKALGLKEEASKHFKSVHEVVYTFEERHGQLSLPKWKIIFEESGCLEDFLGVIESFNEQRHSPGLGPIPVANPRTHTVGDQKNDESGTTSGDGLVPPKEVSGQLLAMSATFSDQLAVSELDNGSMDTAAAARKVTERLLSPSDAKMPSSKVWPPWSLPAPFSEDKQSDDLTNLPNESSTGITAAGIDDSGVFSVSSRDNSVVLSGEFNASSLLSPSSYAETTTAAEEVVASPNSIVVPEQQRMTCVTNQSTSIVPSQFGCLPVSQTSTPVVSRRNATSLVSKSSMPSASQTSAPSSVKSSSRVTRQPSICASNRMVDNQFLSLSAESISDTGQQLQNEISRTEEHHDSCSASSIISSEISSHGSEVHVLQRRETENNDTSENGGLLEEFLKKIEELQSSVNYLTQKLQTKELLYKNLEVRNSNLRMELINCRATCADLEEKLRESTRLIKDSTALVADNKQSINMLQEVVNKEQEKCNMLQEHISQSDATYSCAISSMQALRRENQEVVESLASLRRQMEEAQERPETSMQEERRRLRMEHDKFIEDLLLAFNNTETDKVKGLKLKLSKEKEKRRRVEKRKKEISKEKEELKALVLRQGEIEGDSIAPAAEACGGDSNGQNYELTDAESSSSASEFSSSEAEVNDPTQSLRGSSQHSDSGESSDEGQLFEDAKEYL